MELSFDIVLFHILPRLPTKSLVRFRCVSKEWYSFLTTHKFATMHQLHHQYRHKLLCICIAKSHCLFRTINCDSPEDGLTAIRYLPFKVDSPRHVSVITSFNGLVCVGISEEEWPREYTDLILWNPLTADYKILSKTNACGQCYMSDIRATMLFYVSSLDDYKLLRVINSRVAYVYSLKDDMWRKIESTEDIYGRISEHYASLNEKLYILTYDKRKMSSYSVISLDLETGMFIEVATPFFCNSAARCMGFTVMRGYIYVWMYYFSFPWHKIALWRMDGDGDGDGWTKLVTYSGKFPCCCTGCLEPMHMMADGNWLMRHSGMVCVTDPKYPLNFTRVDTNIFMRITLRGKYYETLESPNQYMK